MSVRDKNSLETEVSAHDAKSACLDALNPRGTRGARVAVLKRCSTWGSPKTALFASRTNYLVREGRLLPLAATTGLCTISTDLRRALLGFAEGLARQDTIECGA